MRSRRVIHTIHSVVSAKSFILPIVNAIHSFESAIWTGSSQKSNSNSDLYLTPNVFRMTAAIFRLVSKFRRYRPVIVHCHQTLSSSIPLLAARIARVPLIIYHNHGVPALGHSGIVAAVLKCIERFNIYLATHSVCVSRENIKHAELNGVFPTGKVSFISPGSISGVDLTTFSPRIDTDDHGIDSSFIVSYVGRPNYRKGFHDLLNAWPLVRASFPTARLMLAGCTQEDVANAGCNDATVIGCGIVFDMPAFYASADIVTLPSHHEGFPYAMLEAAACGKPLVATSVPGMSEIVFNGRNGRLVAVGDIKDLAGAIIWALANRKQLGSEARLIAHNYDRKLVMSSMKKYYDLIIRNQIHLRRTRIS